MPSLDDIMDHELIGPAIRQGMENDIQQGRQEEAVNLLCRLAAERFGPLSASHQAHFAKMSVPELENLGSRLLRVSSVEELFRP